MKIMIMGAGAVGGYFGSHLQEAGNEVYFITRGEHLDRIKERGLMVKSIHGDLHLQVMASNEPSDFGIMDLILVSVKSQDTSSALMLIERNVGKNTLIMSIQNGIGNEEKIAHEYGIQRTLGGVAYISVKVMSPGIIVHEGLGKIVFGRLSTEGPPEERVDEWQMIFKDAGIPARVTDNIMTRKWGKLVWNAAFNPVSVITGLKTHALIVSNELRRILEAIMIEVIQVANRLGHPLNEEDILNRTFDLTMGLHDVKTSMLQDYEKGRKLEIEAMNGAVINAANKLGIPVPLNTAIYGLVKGMERSKKE